MNISIDTLIAIGTLLIGMIGLLTPIYYKLKAILQSHLTLHQKVNAITNVLVKNKDNLMKAGVDITQLEADLKSIASTSGS